MLLLTGTTTLSAADEPSDAEKKLQERLTVLEEIARHELAAYKGGQATFTDVLSARKEVLQAKLELTKDPAKRVEILDEQVKLAKELEETVKRLVEAKEMPKVKLLKVTAARLKAEADLAEAQSRVKPKE